MVCFCLGYAEQIFTSRKSNRSSCHLQCSYRPVCVHYSSVCISLTGMTVDLRRLPPQRHFKIGKRKASGHWQNFNTLQQELQPFLHPVSNDPLIHECHREGPNCDQQTPLSKGQAMSSSSGQQACHKMPTQQELMTAGRMDLLNAVRLWGGFTAVADRMGVLPNTRSPFLLDQKR